ncbi:MAG: Holliday junction resolvase RuvX [Acidobacteria bacterium]|nr:Holliday junction resolvase RuvX [Acidobacteriota bacterium]
MTGGKSRGDTGPGGVGLSHRNAPEAVDSPCGRLQSVCVVRFLGIDIGAKRVGVAVGDSRVGVAVPHTTLRRTSDRQLIAELKALASESDTDVLVVGEPRRLDGSVGSAAERARAFAGKLGEACDLPVRTVDESLTSVEAERRLRAAGVDPRRYPERVDAVAAQILLQEALDQERG